MAVSSSMNNSERWGMVFVNFDWQILRNLRTAIMTGFVLDGAVTRHKTYRCKVPPGTKPIGVRSHSAQNRKDCGLIL